MTDDNGQSSEPGLGDFLAEAYERVLYVRVIRWSTGYLKEASYGLRILIAFLYLLAIYVGLLLVNESKPLDLIWVVGFPLYGFATVSAVDIYVRWAIKICIYDISPQISAEPLRQVGERLAKRFTTLRQLVSGLVVTGVLYAVAIAVTPADLPASEFTLRKALVDAPVMMLYISGFLSLLSFIQVPQWLDENDVSLYALNPGNSVIIQGYIRVARSLIWMVVISSVVVITLYYVHTTAGVGSNWSLFATITGVNLWAAVLVVAVFFQQQYHLSRLTAFRHARTLSDIQTEINDLYQRRATLTDEETAHLDHLRGLHADVSNTNAAAFNLGGALRFLSPVAIPLLIFALNALNLPFSERVTSLLEALR